MSFVWTDATITTKKMVIKKTHITELRSNIDTTHNSLTAHVGSGGANHSIVTSSEAGFMSPEQLAMITNAAADTVDGLHAADIMLPIGSIIIWSGAVANIPVGFALCDGNNGTPDLRSKFVYGASPDVAPGTEGGSATEVLTPSKIPAHRHVDPYAENVNGSAGSNGFDVVPGTYGARGSGDSDNDQYLQYTGYTGGTGYSDAYGKALPSTLCEPHNNIPPYLALAYIMKITGYTANIAGQLGPNADMLDGYHAQDIINMIPAQINYDASHLLATNGYQVFPNGLIFQWGLSVQSFTDSSWKTIMFPMEFPNAVFSIVATPKADAISGGGPSPCLRNFTTTSFQAVEADSSPVSAFTWFAIGR